MLGLIALDMDGTITTESRTIPDEVVTFLANLYQEGWAIAFITGRTLWSSHHALEAIPFPFFLAVQNGALIISMPFREIVFKHYLDKDNLLALSAACKGHSTDVVVYSGAEFDDRCYYRPPAFQQRVLDYVKRRREAYEEIWDVLPAFEDLPIGAFASTKSFGTYEELLVLSTIFENEFNLQAPINRDPFQDGWYVLQTTAGIVNKGLAVRDLRKRVAGDGIVIAAGDDLNDLPLLLAADVKVAMANAPKVLLDVADFVAPPASELGIIAGLQQAIGGLRGQGRV
ncbi:MAG: HAD family hydrolase [Chlamydiales bacterium]|nr:HAD family hydrolase [Chlamydiales bacterium]